MSTYRLLLFDRDGTLTYEEKSAHRDLSTLRSYPFTGAVLRELKGAGYELAVVTNQSGIGRGFWSMAEVQAVHEQLCREWQVALPFFICPHHPDDGCACRKPGTHLLEQAMSDRGATQETSLMIGDSPADYSAAQEAALPFALVLTGRGRTTLNQLPDPPQMILNTIANLPEHLP